MKILTTDCFDWMQQFYKSTEMLNIYGGIDCTKHISNHGQVVIFTNKELNRWKAEKDTKF